MLMYKGKTGGWPWRENEETENRSGEDHSHLAGVMRKFEISHPPFHPYVAFNV